METCHAPTRNPNKTSHVPTRNPLHQTQPHKILLPLKSIAVKNCLHLSHKTYIHFHSNHHRLHWNNKTKSIGRLPHESALVMVSQRSRERSDAKQNTCDYHSILTRVPSITVFVVSPNKKANFVYIKLCGKKYVSFLTSRQSNDYCSTSGWNVMFLINTFS